MAGTDWILADRLIKIIQLQGPDRRRVPEKGDSAGDGKT